MNFIDRAIEYVAPSLALERAKSRAILNSFQGGVPTRNSERWERLQGYRFGTSSERIQIASMRDRAMNAYKNNPVARTLIDTETDNVIGDGLNYQPTSSSKEWNKEAKDRYWQWLEVASVRGPDIHSGCELERLLWTNSRIAGDIGWILVARGPESRIQVIPAENIVTPDGQATDRAIIDGIRFDEFGQPTQFYVLSTDDISAKRTFTAIAARDFVYLPHFRSPSQARPETCYATIFDLLSHLDRYVDGVSLAAWMATIFGVIFKQNNAAKQLNQLSTTVTNSEGNQQKAFVAENNMVKYIGTDEEVAQVQAHQPMQQTPEFIRAMYRMLGQPFDMPLEVLAKDMSTCTFASARIGLLPFYRSCRIKAARFGTRWSRTIRWWLSRERQRAPDDPKRWLTAFPADYWKHDLLVNAWSYTDPVAEAQGDFLEMGMLTKSPQMVIAERGRDGEQVVKEWEEWAKRTDGLPILYSTMTRDAKPEQPASPPASPEDAVKAYARAFRDLVSADGSQE